jgi:hypothetical protein
VAVSAHHSHIALYSTAAATSCDGAAPAIYKLDGSSPGSSSGAAGETASSVLTIWGMCFLGSSPGGSQTLAVLGRR